MRFFEKNHQQHLMISGGDVLAPKDAKAPMINLQLAGEGGRISGTGSLIPVGEPISNFTVTGTTHTFGRQIIISLRVYEWEQFIGTIQIGLNIMTNDGSADYSIRSGKTKELYWKAMAVLVIRIS